MNFMDYALEEAIIARDKGEVPIGAVVVKDNKIIGRGHNIKEGIKNVLGHAEIIAINEASVALNDWRLQGAEMYVTVEPCPMCMGAILQSRIKKIYIGTYNKDMGACGTVINLSWNKKLNSFLDVIWLYDERCQKLISTFFASKRKK